MNIQRIHPHACIVDYNYKRSTKINNGLPLTQASLKKSCTSYEAMTQTILITIIVT